MLLSRNWLKEFVSIDADTRTFAEEMTLSGSKVEATELPGHEIQNVIIGRIESIVPHPDSDHMVICQMNVGKEELIQIVTGAPNVKEGQYVPVAMDDSYLPGGVHITAGKLRGELSNGMLCSTKELGLTASHDCPYTIDDGIMILSDDPDLQGKLTLGDSIWSVFDMGDEVVEFEITPNRPDCLSVIGLAREAAVTFRKPLSLHTPVVKGSGGAVIDHVDIEITDGELCPRYTARMVKNVKIAPSPLWLRNRLRNSGVRPINNIVDISNYVMLEYGQPMHAFDFSCVEGGTIVVRNAYEGETIETLDGTVRKLTPSMLCICDQNRPVCVAGVMGGANSEIVGDTAMVLFESANFSGPSIRRTATALGMRTDASSRYEKGLDPMVTMAAVNRACELVELLGCGEVIDGVMDVIGKDSWRTTLDLQADRINNLLGTDVSAQEMIDILEPLGFTVDGTSVTVPSWRGDVEHYSDLSEEVARFVGFNNIPVTLMKGDTAQGGYSPVQLAERTVGATCRTLGYDEIITYSFISPSYYNKINLPAESPLRKSLTILNPLGEDTSIMRTTTLPSMLEILSRNYNYRNPRAWMYELGRVYFAREDGLADEPKILSLGAYGGDVDFFSMKAAVEAVLDSLGITGARYVAQKENPSYHPGRCADVYLGDVRLGVLGQIHPDVADNYDVDVAMYCAEISFDTMFETRGAMPIYQPLPKFPAVIRDLALLCDRDLPVMDLMDCIRDGSKGLLKSVSLFDIYMGPGVAEDKKSVAFNLQLRSDEGNLTAAQADEDVKSILILLNERLGAVLR